MSYVGEYMETPYLQHNREGDPYLNEFRVTRSFPAITPVVLDHSAPKEPRKYKTTRRVKHQQTQKSVFRAFKRSVLQSGRGPISDFQKSLIKEKISAKQMELSKERTRLQQTVEARERDMRLNDPDVMNRALAKMEYFARDFDVKKVLAKELLKGFTGRKMRCVEFREQLRRSLALRLTTEETKALMTHFDGDEDGYIECHEFMLHFFKMMFNARSALRSKELEQMEQKDRAERDAKKLKEHQEQVRNFAIINTPYTADDLRTGIEALSRLAIWWDFGSYRDKLFIDPFFAILTPLQFQLQLKQSFGIKRTDAEMAALCRFFDTNNDGTVDGTEFLRGFFKMQQDFHVKVADRVNYDNQCRLKMLESSMNKRNPVNTRDTSGLRRSQYSSPIAKLPLIDHKERARLMREKEYMFSRRRSTAGCDMAKTESADGSEDFPDLDLSNASNLASAAARRASLLLITSSKDKLHADSTLFGVQPRHIMSSAIEFPTVMDNQCENPTQSSVIHEGTHALHESFDQLGRRILNDEKMKMLQKRMQSAMYGSDPRKFFGRYDIDGGGKLDSEELKRCVRGNMKVGRKQLSEDDLNAFVNTLDTDGDGVLSLQEVLNFVRPQQQKETQQLDEAAVVIQNALRRHAAYKTASELRRQRL